MSVTADGQHRPQPDVVAVEGDVERAQRRRPRRRSSRAPRPAPRRRRRRRSAARRAPPRRGRGCARRPRAPCARWPGGRRRRRAPVSGQRKRPRTGACYLRSRSANRGPPHRYVIDLSVRASRDPLHGQDGSVAAGTRRSGHPFCPPGLSSARARRVGAPGPTPSCRRPRPARRTRPRRRPRRTPGRRGRCGPTPGRDPPPPGARAHSASSRVAADARPRPRCSAAVHQLISPRRRTRSTFRRPTSPSTASPPPSGPTTRSRHSPAARRAGSPRIQRSAAGGRHLRGHARARRQHGVAPRRHQGGDVAGRRRPRPEDDAGGPVDERRLGQPERRSVGGNGPSARPSAVTPAAARRTTRAGRAGHDGRRPCRPVGAPRRPRPRARR